MSFIQNIVDIIRLKSLKNYLNFNPTALRLILNFLSLFEYGNRNSVLQSNLLRFIGCNVGKNVHIGSNIYIYRAKNLTLGDNVAIGDNNVFMCWNKIDIKSLSFTSVDVKFVAGTHNTFDYSNVTDNQEIIIEEGVWLGASSTLFGGVKVGKGSIVGGGAICLPKTYKEFCIYAGVPAKEIKQREPAKNICQPVVYKLEEIINEQNCSDNARI